MNVTANSELFVSDMATELPVKNDPEHGEEIPRIVIGTGRFDPIEDVFAKLRMGPITPLYGFDYEAYMADPAAWGVELAVYEQPRALEAADFELTAASFLSLLQGEALADYHFVFAPCANPGSYQTLMTSQGTRNKLRAYVNGGGKLYVTDYAYDLVEQVFPEYIDFAKPGDGDGNADAHVGDRDYMGLASASTLRYQSENAPLEPVLRDWLAVVGASTNGRVLTEGNWVNLRGVGTVTACCDSQGHPANITPAVTMSGPNGVDPLFGSFGPSHDSWDDAEEDDANRPHTVHFPYGCGNVMFSTYHTAEEPSGSLAAQEMVLLYLILDINQCNARPIKI